MTVFFFKQKTAYEIMLSFVGSEMCIRDRKYILLSGSMLFGGIFLACEPVVQPNRWSSRLIYGLFLGAMATAFRYYSVYETGVCFAIVLAGAFPEWLDRLAQRAERIRFMRKEEKRLAQHREP